METLPALIDMTRAGELAGVTDWTVWHWVTHGIGGVKLRAVRAGRAWKTTAPWLLDFWERLAAQGVHHRPKKLRQ